MTLTFYAQPYDITAEGFYFRDLEEYDRQAATLKNSHGDPVEEFEIQFIDGENIICELTKAWGVNQGNLGALFEAAEDWSDDQKTRYIIAVGECGYGHDQVADAPEDIDLTIYELDSLKELACELVSEGLFGDIPQTLEFYIDYEAIARDLSADYTETVIAGTNLIYRCA